LRRDSIRLIDVMGVFGTLAEVDAAGLRPMTAYGPKDGDRGMPAALFRCGLPL
jgi:hypothetical protein